MVRLRLGRRDIAQLKTGLWIDALIRRAQVAGAFACVVGRGDREVGTVLITVRARDGLSLYTPERDMSGDRVWRGEDLDEEALAARIKSRLDFDPDIILVEIEDAQGRHFIEEPVLNQSAQADEGAAAAAARALFRDR